jgi:hypothetical protein
MVLLVFPDSAFRISVACARLEIMLASVFGAIWSVVTLPIRVVVWVVEMLGRATGLVLGFAMMVIGIALWAGPLFYFGIPLFIVGLLLTLRNLG